MGALLQQVLPCLRFRLNNEGFTSEPQDGISGDLLVDTVALLLCLNRRTAAGGGGIAACPNLHGELRIMCRLHLRPREPDGQPNFVRLHLRRFSRQEINS